MNAVDCCDGFVLDSGCYLLQYVLAAMSTFLAVGVYENGEIYWGALPVRQRPENNVRHKRGASIENVPHHNLL